MDENDFDSDEENFVAESQEDDQMTYHLPDRASDKTNSDEFAIISVPDVDEECQVDTNEQIQEHDEGQCEILEQNFGVGDFVVVESRTWPGMNKQGGAGRIISVKEHQTKGL